MRKDVDANRDSVLKLKQKCKRFEAKFSDLRGEIALLYNITDNLAKTSGKRKRDEVVVEDDDINLRLKGRTLVTTARGGVGG